MENFKASFGFVFGLFVGAACGQVAYDKIVKAFGVETKKKK